MRRLLVRQVRGVFHDSARGEAPVVASDRALYPPGSVIRLVQGDGTSMMIGGFVILLVERFAKPEESGGVAALSTRQSTLICFVQCLALGPGVSRSVATIIGAGRTEKNLTELPPLMRT